MERVRWVHGLGTQPPAACSRCRAAGCPWDRIADEIICPDCQDLLVRDEGPPLIARVRPAACAVCGHRGVLPFVTVPLYAANAVEIDLCGAHLQALLRRRLDRFSYRQLADQLRTLGIQSREVFLLHEAFYDDFGQPLYPVIDSI
jgi:hypothetical protein